MKANEILYFEKINETTEEKVNELKSSMIEKGYIGCPILTCGTILVTGSHRLQAIIELNEMLMEDIDETTEEAIENLMEEDLCEDVTEIVEDYMETNGIDFDEIDFSSLGSVFSGTWVEEYKEDIAEW